MLSFHSVGVVILINLPLLSFSSKILKKASGIVSTETKGCGVAIHPFIIPPFWGCGACPPWYMSKWNKGFHFPIKFWCCPLYCGLMWCGVGRGGGGSGGGGTCMNCTPGWLVFLLFGFCWLFWAYTWLVGGILGVACGAAPLWCEPFLQETILNCGIYCFLCLVCRDGSCCVRRGCFPVVVLFPWPSVAVCACNYWGCCVGEVILWFLVRDPLFQPLCYLWFEFYNIMSLLYYYLPPCLPLIACVCSSYLCLKALLCTPLYPWLSLGPTPNCYCTPVVIPPGWLNVPWGLLLCGPSLGVAPICGVPSCDTWISLAPTPNCRCIPVVNLPGWPNVPCIVFLCNISFWFNPLFSIPPCVPWLRYAPTLDCCCTMVVIPSGWLNVHWGVFLCNPFLEVAPRCGFPSYFPWLSLAPTPAFYCIPVVKPPGWSNVHCIVFLCDITFWFTLLFSILSYVPRFRYAPTPTCCFTMAVIPFGLLNVPWGVLSCGAAFWFSSPPCSWYW